jgi:hypothetical protein
MAALNLKKLDFDGLLALRGQIESRLSSMRGDLERQLATLARNGGDHAVGNARGATRKSKLAGRKVAAKYRDKQGNAWSGRGAMARWLRDAIKAGAKLEDFAVSKASAGAKAVKRAARKMKRKVRR